MQDRVLYAVIVGFVAGIFLRSFADFGIGFSLLFLLLGAALALAERKTTLAAFLLIAAGLGMLRFDFADRAAPPTALNPYLGQTALIEGVVADEADERETHTRLTVRVEQANGEKIATRTKVLVIAPREPRYEYGDRIRLEGVVKWPKNFTDATTLRGIDYRAHLAKDGIYYEMLEPRITWLARGEGNPLAETLFTFKRAFIGNLNALLPQPHAALLAGLVVGAKQSLGKKLLDDFRTVGVIHIVVLSGYNITIIARFIEWLFSMLPRGKRLLLSVGAMVLFAIMVGASATVVRATLMALLVVLARATGRLYAVTRALLIAGFLMLLQNPKILVFDTSFQLSFLATVGLIYISPLVEPRVRWITERWGLREIAVATIATQVLVLPFLLYKTGVLSLVSLPVNLLVLAAIPLTMFFGFFAGLIGFALPALAAPFAFLSFALLSYELAVVEWFARLPFAAVSVASFPLWLAALWYGVYALILFLWRREKS